MLPFKKMGKVDRKEEKRERVGKKGKEGERNNLVKTDGIFLVRKRLK